MADIFTDDPFIVTAPVEFPKVKVDKAVDARVVSPLDESVVNAADEVDVNPMAVPLIPVAVVLKLCEVMSKSLLPDKAILEEDRLDKESAPDVPVIFTAPAFTFTFPLSTVNPLPAVKSPEAVIVPFTPFVVILPEVVALPFSSMVRVGIPFD